MERVAKFYISQGQTGITANVTTGLQSIISPFYRLPNAFFPLQPNQSARFTLLNLMVKGVGALQGSFIAGQLDAFGDGNTGSYIVSFPGFPLASSAIISGTPSPGGFLSPTLILPIVNAGWEWDTFVTTSFSPRFLAGVFSLNATTPGGVFVGFQGVLEIWRL